MRYLILSLLLVCSFANAAENLVIVTIDGMRWQDVFRGADDSLMKNKKFNHDTAETEKLFGGKTRAERRQKLMPFVTHTMQNEGVIIGDRDAGSQMTVTNPWWFSYPGYNEMLTGQADPKVDSNDKIPNKNVTFFEWLNKNKGFQNNIAVFGSWDAFPYIINRQRSGLRVNAGFEASEGYDASEEVKVINKLEKKLVSPWPSERMDSMTFPLAKDYLLKQKPRVLYIAFGDTDEFAHEGNYDNYLRAAHQADSDIAELWRTLQSMPQYAGKTDLIVTVDHGRGRTAKDWRHHASLKAVGIYPNGKKMFPNGIPGSNEIWLAAMGPDVKKLGVLKTQKPYEQNQVAATALMLLGMDPAKFKHNIGAPITAIKK
ncbi:alkaline phosphatase family protein [Gallaecimonas sp. GXIMD1310]|uniref:alkaline phosphatase family protein n=1 Tax=Gallaecimonas sp. GXIMD1310 TaxID=3131926 RepID=UPI00324E5469